MHRSRSPARKPVAGARPGPCWRRSARRSPRRRRRRARRQCRVERGEVVVRNDDRVGDRARGHARRARQAERRDAAARLRRAARRRDRGSSPRTSRSCRGRSRRGRGAPRSSRLRCPTRRAAPSRPTARARRSPRRARPRVASARRTTCRRPRRAARPRRPPGARGRGSTRPTTARSRGTRARRCRRGARRSPRATKNGSPPTEPNARTGELTPPGMRACARSNQDSPIGCYELCSELGDLAREVREDDVGAGPLDREQVLERDGADRRASRAGPRPCTIAYSPLTWYAATGTSNAARTSRDHVEVRERGLHHHHVGALVDVERDLGRAPRARWRGPSGSRAGRRTAARTRRRRGTGRRAPTRTSPRRRGSRCRRGRCSSSAARIAPTWPSIIPDGAITSAPASACATAMLGVALERRVVVDLAAGGEDAAVAVVGVLVEAVVGHQHERVADLVAQVAQRDLHDAVGGVGLRAARVLLARGRRTASPRGRRDRRARAPPCGGSPACAARRPASTRPARARRCPPSRTAARRGRRRATRCSATSRRSAGVRRSRRMRRSGKVTGRCYRSVGTAQHGADGVDQAVDRVRIGLGVDREAAARAPSAT